MTRDTEPIHTDLRTDAEKLEASGFTTEEAKLAEVVSPGLGAVMEIVPKDGASIYFSGHVNEDGKIEITSEEYIKHLSNPMLDLEP